MLSSSPLVSVIIPTYNRAKLLPRALESVLAQDYPHLEIIVIDDASTDETPNVLKAFADPRIQVFRHPENKGHGAACETGIRCAKGELIAFLDSDDVWLPGKLGLQVAIFRQWPHVDFHFTNFRNINLVNGVEGDGFTQTRDGLALLQTEHVDTDLWIIQSGMPQAMLQAMFIAKPTVMLRREVITTTGNFNSELRGAEDLELWWRIALSGFRFSFSKRPLMERYKDSQSTTSKVIAFSLWHIRALEYCEATAREAGRLDLIPPLNSARYRSWCGLVKEYARVGRRREALHAFSQALRYGFTPQLLLYGALALGGAQTFSLARSIRRAVVGGSR